MNQFMKETNTIIIGASAAGLACAAQLKKRNIDFEILEKHRHVGHAWRNHYDRLHLHTNKSASDLPFVKWPVEDPKYPSRNQVVSYMENYCKTIGIEPIFGAEVSAAERKEEKWWITTSLGTLSGKNVIVCTGNTNMPKMISKPGLDSFPGETMHSSEYSNGKQFIGKNVLVIGFGNSACEIALDLHEHGAHPALSVRSEVNVIPRDVLGIPSLQIGIFQSKLPPKVADMLNAPIIKLTIGDIEQYGLRKSKYGPTEQIVKTGRIPLLDIGTMDLIRKGAIKVFGDATKIEGSNITFENGKVASFDSIIFAVGYETGIDKFLSLTRERETDYKKPIRKRNMFGKDNLYFCGYYVSPSGMLREIKIESGIIAEAIQKRQ